MERVRKPDARDGWYRISPASAAKLLDEGHKNRPLSEHRAEFIAQSIRDGKFTENGETIVMDDSGRMLDGQHRARGIQMAGRTVVSYVVWLPKVSAQVFDSIDCGWTRNPAHRLALDGVINYSACSATVKLIMAYEAGLSANSLHTTRRITPGDIRVRRAKDAEAIDSAVAYCVKRQADLRGRSPLAVAAFTLYFARRLDSRMADAFLDGVLSGENLSARSPAMVLRNRLIQNGLSKAKLPHREIQALWVRAWNHYYRRKELKQLKWHNQTAFPRFDGEDEEAA